MKLIMFISHNGSLIPSKHYHRNINITMKKQEACADPENFLRGGATPRPGWVKPQTGGVGGARGGGSDKFYHCEKWL